jgi:GDPmannose 4,6-dehydratase
MPPRRALITGITGQDGSYLAELLLANGYEVHGVVRQPPSRDFDHIENVRGSLVIHHGDLRDQDFAPGVIADSRPDEVYNLAAMSSAAESWSRPALAGDLSGLAVTRLLESVRELSPRARFFQASSSEVFRGAREEPQSETTPIHPANPYGAAKAYAQFMTGCYREQHGLFACSGILFNHESPRRGLDFVPRKVTRSAAAIKLGHQKELSLGSLDAQRDWGFARDYVAAMWLMLQAQEPRDYVIATGQLHSVRELVEIAFERVGLEPERYVTVDPRFVRGTEERHLVGDSSRIRQRLGWQPGTTFRELVGMMVDADLESLEAEGSAAT